MNGLYLVYFEYCDLQQIFRSYLEIVEIDVFKNINTQVVPKTRPGPDAYNLAQFADPGQKMTKTRPKNFHQKKN